eukprot:CAMPEP_0114455194 /NCGR_PEP_ID=MMETSP0104-20121206/2971_1 /TAXON_ID=37642 ORGANISM="Paraphysomonas imperforata, Strain PA2" /NCGR_SAMPLE_ID=MMETSP0104 /ASSEMBLY_ACC=CAM_ASM_000202 /LENGTH=277 /DNA_ID=CAMNT_0001627601 /DNA_START=23 /DNA_END=856 /DNA_ORIENTATION=+
MPATFICHGGGPLPLLGADPEAAQFLSEYPKSIPTPSAILVISAHWITHRVSVTSSKQHPLLFDYSGFPSETYQYTYPAPGSPDLASKVCDLLADHNIPCDKDPSRGWDHGVFVPLKIMYPEASIPVVEMSIQTSMDPLAHIKLGQALASLRDEGVLILASGMSFHNFGYFFAKSPTKRAEGLVHSRAFDKSLVETFTSSPPLSVENQISSLVNWSQLPSATDCHPLGQEEHLIPLHVAFGAGLAAGDDAPSHTGAESANKHFGYGQNFVVSNFEFN